MKNTKLATILCLVAGFLFLYSPNTSAQNNTTVGLKGGLNYSTFNNTDNVEYKAGLLAGTFINIKIPESPVAIQPELLFAQYGANIEDSDGKFSVNYVQLPVLAEFYYGDEYSSTRPKVFFGPYLGFNVGAELENPDIAINAEDYFSNTDAGVVVGAGVDVNNVVIGFRYTAGLTNVVSDEDYQDEQKNGAFALTLGVKF